MDLCRFVPSKVLSLTLRGGRGVGVGGGVGVGILVGLAVGVAVGTGS